MHLGRGGTGGARDDGVSRRRGEERRERDGPFRIEAYIWLSLIKCKMEVEETEKGKEEKDFLDKTTLGGGGRGGLDVSPENVKSSG